MVKFTFQTKGPFAVLRLEAPAEPSMTADVRHIGRVAQQIGTVRRKPTTT